MQGSDVHWILLLRVFWRFTCAVATPFPLRHLQLVCKDLGAFWTSLRLSGNVEHLNHQMHWHHVDITDMTLFHLFHLFISGTRTAPMCSLWLHPQSRRLHPAVPWTPCKLRIALLDLFQALPFWFILSFRCFSCFFFVLSPLAVSCEGYPFLPGPVSRVFARVDST